MWAALSGAAHHHQTGGLAVGALRGCPKDVNCDCGWMGRHTLEGEAALHWVIAGGESGPKARPMHPDWARSLRDQCAAAGVPFMFKQWGEWAEDDLEHQLNGSAEFLAVRGHLSSVMIQSVYAGLALSILGAQAYRHQLPSIPIGGVYNSTLSDASCPGQGRERANRQGSIACGENRRFLRGRCSD